MGDFSNGEEPRSIDELHGLHSGMKGNEVLTCIYDMLAISLQYAEVLKDQSFVLFCFFLRQSLTM